MHSLRRFRRSFSVQLDLWCKLSRLQIVDSVETRTIHHHHHEIFKMLQFSQNEFDTVMTEIDNRDAIYSPQKNIMSYTFSQISQSHDRGTAGEHFMCNKLRSQYGINAVQVGGKGNPDIEITHDDGTVSIAECKTSLLNVSGKYNSTT